MTIAYNFWTGVTTARQIILDVCMALIYMPVPGEDEWTSIADEFHERWNFPMVSELLMANM